MIGSRDLAKKENMSRSDRDPSYVVVLYVHTPLYSTLTNFPLH